MIKLSAQSLVVSVPKIFVRSLVSVVLAYQSCMATSQVKVILGAFSKIM